MCVYGLYEAMIFFLAVLFWTFDVEKDKEEDEASGILGGRVYTVVKAGGN